jgi:hypothetical protein
VELASRHRGILEFFHPRASSDPGPMPSEVPISTSIQGVIRGPSQPSSAGSLIGSAASRSPHSLQSCATGTGSAGGRGSTTTCPSRGASHSREEKLTGGSPNTANVRSRSGTPQRGGTSTPPNRVASQGREGELASDSPMTLSCQSNPAPVGHGSGADCFKRGYGWGRLDWLRAEV